MSFKVVAELLETGVETSKNLVFVLTLLESQLMALDIDS
jgi:hypothetical protein